MHSCDGAAHHGVGGLHSPRCHVTWRAFCSLTEPLDGTGHWCLAPPQIQNQLPYLCHIELQIVLLTLCDKVSHPSPVLSFLTLANISNYNGVIRNRSDQKSSEDCRTLFNRIHSIESEEEVRQDCPLWDPSVIDHSVRHTVLQRTYCGLTVR